MISQSQVILCLVGAGVLALLFLVARLYFITKHLNNSFAKLGFLMREDAKKYFDDAAGKIVDTNEQFQKMYQGIVEEGTKKVLMDSGVVMEKSIMDAQAKAGTIIIGAQSDAQNIIKAAEGEAQNKLNQSLQQAVDTLGWTMEQYLKEHYSLSEHEAQIQQLVDKYVDEHRN
jgi:polyhydroxyalkanoate synthesis regulator phasin